jgi:hypothetical protein
MVHGYDVELLEEPYYVSRGEWALTGTQSCQAYDLLKRTSTLVSGLWGASGVYAVWNFAEVYDDISGISGTIGCSLHKLRTDTDTGMTNINQVFARRQIDVCHFGVVKLPYVSGTLDGTVLTLKWGDKLAPCQSGFRAFEEINVVEVTGLSDAENVLCTGTRQCLLGHYMDTPSNITGTTGFARKKVFIYPSTLYGANE